MRTLRETIAEAASRKVAVGHFNISNLEGVWAAFRAAQAVGAKSGKTIPVIIGVSEGEREFVGVPQVAALVASIREEYQHPIYLNADHTYSFQKVKEAIDAGFDAVIIDGAKLPYEQNVALAKECVAYARRVSGRGLLHGDIFGRGRDVLIEGELGFIGQSSKLLDSVPEGVALSGEALTKPEDAARFVRDTGVDMLAPAVGNFHGLVKNMDSLPEIDTKRVGEIAAATGVPLVLHGGSGSSEKEFKGAIANGVACVHINTELRVAYRAGLEKALKEMPNELSPYKYLKVAGDAMQAVIEEKLKIFNNL